MSGYSSRRATLVLPEPELPTTEMRFKNQRP